MGTIEIPEWLVPGAQVLVYSDVSNGSRNPSKCRVRKVTGQSFTVDSDREPRFRLPDCTARVGGTWGHNRCVVPIGSDQARTEIEQAHIVTAPAGLRQLRRARSTGHPVGVYDGEPAGLDTAGGRWQTICETHSTVCSHQTLATARDCAAAPEQWCEPCAQEQKR